MSDDFDRLMRDTLETEAQSYEPSGDGLTKIRSRIAARRARLRWLVPSVGLVAAAAAVAGVIVLPTLLPSPAPTRPPIAQPGSPGTTTPSPGSSTTAGPSSPAPDQLPDMVTVWPYQSRREAAAKLPWDVSAGTLPNMSDARQTALLFVQRFVKVNGTLQVVRTSALEAGVGVTLGRKNPNGQLFDVTTVYLVRVARGDGAPYVVVRADAPGLRIGDVSANSAGVVTVTGTVPGVHQSILASLLDRAGGTVVTGYDGAAGAERPWSVTLGSTAKPVPTGTYAVAAQTSSDADGFISELVVRAYARR